MTQDISQTALLDRRGVIRITGEDRQSFLQGIVTQDMRQVGANHLLYGCFLTPQGKYLADFFVVAQDDAWLLDVDIDVLPSFIKRLTMFKLRSKVVIEDVSDRYRVYAFCGAAQSPEQACKDPRWNDLGYRLITQDDVPYDPQADYMLWQMQNGVTDAADFESERTSMLEANMDKLNALSWDKGCYMGQELTARTHYRGLVKKRFLPVQLTTQSGLEKDTPVQKDGKTIGSIRRQHANWAMAHMMVEAAAHGTEVVIADQPATIVIPSWFGDV